MLITTEHHYRVELFYTIVDMQLQELNDHFTETNTQLLLCMDALNELRDIEKLQNTRNKLKEAIEAIDEAKELEMNLATTLYDIDTLKNEFKFVKKTGKRLLRRGGQSIEHIEED